MKAKIFLGILFILLVGCTAQDPNVKVGITSDSGNTDNTEDYPFIYNMHEHLEPVAYDNMKEAMELADVKKIVIVGSPEATLYKNPKPGFQDYDENNAALLELSAKDPDTITYCTIDPSDDQNLEKFKKCVQKGSKGLKLYSGHSVLFYNASLNISQMYPVYQYCEDNDIPILFHANPGKFTIQEEFEQILKDFPDLRVNCPHFCLSTINLTRFEYLMDTYPNLYTDISFGFYVEDGLKRISKNVSKYKPIFEKYQDRIFFGTDMVVTSAKYKTVEWIYNLTMCYRDLLEEESYQCSVGTTMNQNFNGLDLDKGILRKIYYDNPREWLKET